MYQLKFYSPEKHDWIIYGEYQDRKDKEIETVRKMLMKQGYSIILEPVKKEVR